MGCCCVVNPTSVDDIEQNLTDSRVLLQKNKQAQVFKEQGNDHFKIKAYKNAIKCYKQALLRNSNQLVYYTNLALAYKADSQFQEAILTIEKLLSNKSVSSVNYTQLVSKGRIIKARCINSVTKKYIVSNDYSQQQSSKMLGMIQEAIGLLNDAKKTSNIQIDQYLNNSLKIKMYLAKIKKKTSEVQVVDYLKRKIRQSKNGLHTEKNWSKIQQYFPDQSQFLKEIQSYYAKCHRKFIQEAEQDEQYLIDPITYQKYKQPVIVPSGITYEENTLRQYFQKGSQYKDPITKQKFQVGQKVIVRNNSIKNYISEMGKIHQIRKEDIELLVC